MIQTLPKPEKPYPRGLRAAAHYEGKFVELLNKKMEIFLKNYEANKSFNNFNENMELNKNENEED